MSKASAVTNHPKHRLLLYERQFGLWRGPALLVAVLAGVLAWWAPGPFGEQELRIPITGAAVVSGIFFLYALIGPRLAYVQCRPTYLLLSTPLFRLAISYSRIRTTRPIPFQPGTLKTVSRRVTEPYLGQTQLAVDLNRYPIGIRWLRFFLMEPLLPHNFVGLQLLVHDWMALSLNIEAHRASWKTRRRDQDREDPLTSITGKSRY